MVYTDADKDKMSLDVKKRTTNIEELDPIDGLDFDKFSKDLSANMNDPESYTKIFKGFFKRLKLNSGAKSVQLMDEYLRKLRTASDSAMELQTTLLKNKIIFMYQAQFAEKRLKHQWGVEEIGFEYEIESKKADIEEKRFWAKFYKETDPKDLSETALLLLSMVRPKSVSATSSRANLFESQSNGTAVTYGSVEGVLQARTQSAMQQPLMDMIMNKMIAELDIVKGTAKKTNAEARKSEAQASLEEWDVKEQMK